MIENDSPETKIAPENGWLEYWCPFGMAYFQGRTVSFRYLLSHDMKNLIPRRRALMKGCGRRKWHDKRCISNKRRCDFRVSWMITISDNRVKSTSRIVCPKTTINGCGQLSMKSLDIKYHYIMKFCHRFVQQFEKANFYDFCTKHIRI